jgi:hypothetical protein
MYKLAIGEVLGLRFPEILCHPQVIVLLGTLLEQ